jgi:glycosyltransferase involved in cell wall biosynthesis
MPMKIDYVTTIDYRGIAGKEKATKEKAASLKNITNSFELFTINRQEKDVKKIISFIVLELKYIFRKLTRNNIPDIIFCRCYIGIGPLIISKIYSTKLIHEVHADFFDEAKILYKNQLSKLFFAQIIHQLQLFVYKRSSGLIFNNELLEIHFKKNYNLRNKTISISNGCDINTFYPMGVAYSKEKLGLNEKKRYLLFLGRISIWHGIEKILDIFCKFNFSNLSLLIVGESQNKKYYRELKTRYKSDNIIFTGSVNHSQALFFFNASELLLIPVNNIRISPGSPLKLFDAIACGKPVVVQENTPGYSNIVHDYKLGLVTDYNNISKASSDINKFIKKLSYTDYVSHNRSVATNYFSWDKIIKRWLEFSETIK